MITQRLPSRVNRDATTPTRDNQSTPRAITVSESPVYKTVRLAPAASCAQGPCVSQNSVATLIVSFSPHPSLLRTSPG
jgi:hypothetical protein